MLIGRSAAVSLVALGLCGCQPGQLYVAANTSIGVNASVNTARTAGHLQIGYDRQFATIVPRSVDLPANATDTGLATPSQGKEIMAVVSCSDVEIQGIFLTKFVESLATGRAARGFARRLADDQANANSIFACFNAQ